MNGNSKQMLATGVIALVVGLASVLAALTTLGEAAGLTTESKVRQMIEDHCPYAMDRNVIVESVAGLEAAVTANTNAMGTLQTTVAVLAERMKHLGQGGG